MQRLAKRVTPNDLPIFTQHLPITQTAIRFAGHLHRHQARASDGAKFIIHPLEMASLLYTSAALTEIVAAGILHDMIEDTSTVIQEIRLRFGDDIATLCTL